MSLVLKFYCNTVVAITIPSYEGDWSNDKRNGWGRRTWTNYRRNLVITVHFHKELLPLSNWFSIALVLQFADLQAEPISNC
jgi:hypothetical protein